MSKIKYITGILFTLVIAYIVGYLVYCYKLVNGGF